MLPVFCPTDSSMGAYMNDAVMSTVRHVFSFESLSRINCENPSRRFSIKFVERTTVTSLHRFATLRPRSSEYETASTIRGCCHLCASKEHLSSASWPNRSIRFHWLHSMRTSSTKLKHLSGRRQEASREISATRTYWHLSTNRSPYKFPTHPHMTQIFLLEYKVPQISIQEYVLRFITRPKFSCPLSLVPQALRRGSNTV